jgi:putative ABC transport system permease protein
MDALWQDLRFAIRTLSRAPGLVLVATLTLALGIGANSAAFSLVNAILLRPLPFADPERLVVIFERSRGFDHGAVSTHEFVAWRAENRSFDDIAMYGYTGFTLTGTAEPTSVKAQITTANFFDVLGRRAIVGRTFGKGEDASGANAVAILGHAFWMSRFGGDSNVIGKRILLDGRPFQVIGVVSNSADMDFDVWVPFDLAAEARKVGKHSFLVVGRLKPGITIASATADLTRVAEALERRYPTDNVGHRVYVGSIHDETVGDVRRPLLVALGAALFVLLIACANVGHLMLTRAAARQREFAVRLALGAGRARLARQLVTETLLLSVAGGGVALLLLTWGLDAVPALAALHIPRLADLRIDWRVVAATAAACVFAAVGCGIAPAFRASVPQLRGSLAEGARTTTGPGRRIAGLLVVSEVALALILLVGAGLMLKSFARLTGVEPGFDSRNVLTVPIALAGPRYNDPNIERQSVARVIDDIARLPGVRSVGGASTLPLGACCNSMGVTVEGKPAPLPGQEVQVRMSVVSGSYFDAMRIAVRRGRAFAASDARLAVPLIRWYPEQPPPARFDEPQPIPVGVISEAMARRFWPDEDPVGKRFRVLFSPWVTVIGIVANVKQQTLREPAIPEMYLFDQQEPVRDPTLVVRTAIDPTSIAPMVRERIRALDRDLPIGAVQPMSRVVWSSVGPPRFNVALLGLAGVFALVLALIGVYGVISYSVERRTHEIGIRRALGAQAGDVLSLVLNQAMTLVAIGIALGVLGALALTRVLTTLLFEVRPTDPGTFAVVAVLLAGVAFVAGYLPGRRAMRVDPTDALKAE